METGLSDAAEALLEATRERIERATLTGFERAEHGDRLHVPGFRSRAQGGEQFGRRHWGGCIRHGRRIAYRATAGHRMMPHAVIGKVLPRHLRGRRPIAECAPVRRRRPENRSGTGAGHCKKQSDAMALAAANRTEQGWPFLK